MKLVCVDLYEDGFLVSEDKECVKRNLFVKIYTHNITTHSPPEHYGLEMR